MREDGRVRNAALLALAGLSGAYLRAEWPDDITILEAIAEEIEEVHSERRHLLAREVASEVARSFGGRPA